MRDHHLITAVLTQKTSLCKETNLYHPLSLIPSFPFLFDLSAKPVWELFTILEKERIVAGGASVMGHILSTSEVKWVIS